ncbi:MAG TPA: ABC transporter permease [Aquabacterium sp.]|nr:ABC transporter permease [Aquabacterium sp.]HQC94711.1 ABC transporter permease [Aquabacterium sp.]
MIARWLFRGWCAAVLAFLLVPIAAIVPLSFSSGSFLSYPLPGWSLRWYAEVLGGGKWLQALGNSLLVGVLATALALVLGTLAALGLARQRGPLVGALKLLMLSPMIVPTILVAVGAYFFLAPLALTASITGLVLVHTVIAVPFVVVPVLTALELLDPNLARAAAACGASPATTFGRITLPAIAPALGSGGLFAFAASFDDVVVALLIAGPGQRTLPREMFSGLRDSITPALTAVATLMIVFSTALFLGMQALQRRARRRQAAGS